jgi:hypothetical protein
MASVVLAQEIPMPIKSVVKFDAGDVTRNAIEVRQVLWHDMSDFTDTINHWAPQTWGAWHANGLGDVEAARNAVRRGLVRTVAETDKLLAKLEERQHEKTTAFRTINDVCGGAPNVGAFLAGNPLNMRRRQRHLSQVAPLTIYADLTSSGGVAEYVLRKRGIALLALTRVLSTLRPVTLRVGCALGNHRSDMALMSWVTLDTAPLDLARADFMLTHAAVSRGIMYSLINQQLYSTEGGHAGSWPLDNYQTWTKHASDIIKKMSGNDEVLYVPALFLSDKEDVWDNPVKFIEDMIRKYGGAYVEEEAA